MRYLTKRKWILKYVSGKKVLDLGCVGQDSTSDVSSDLWLHGQLSNSAKELVGVDINEEGLKALKDNGFNVHYANVEEMALNDKFDVIVAGDIIEHVSNVGNFLSRVEEHLEDDGVFLVCTPNPMIPMQFASLLLRGSMMANDEHTCWITKEVMAEACRRYNLEIADMAFVYNLYPYRKPIWWPLVALYGLLTFLRPEFCETHCYLIKKTASKTN